MRIDRIDPVDKAAPLHGANAEVVANGADLDFGQGRARGFLFDLNADALDHPIVVFGLRVAIQARVELKDGIAGGEPEGDDDFAGCVGLGRAEERV